MVNGEALYAHLIHRDAFDRPDLCHYPMLDSLSGGPIMVGRMEVHPGALLHGDGNGVLTVPGEIAAEVPAVAAQLQRAEQKVIEFCRSGSFSVAGLSEIMKPLI